MSNPELIAIFLRDEDETLAAAARLAPTLQAGDTLTLHGDLGAGKTTFTRGLVRALGSPAPVSSPTFTLIHEYPGGRLPVVHVDAYRLTGAGDAESIGLTDYLNQGDSVVVIEWPERVAGVLPVDRLKLTLSEQGEGRCLRIKAMGKFDAGRWAHIVAAFAEMPPC